MRTLKAINEDIVQAVNRGDVPSLRALAAEMQTLGTPEAAAHACHALGTIEALTGDFSAALEHYRRALAMHEEQGVRAGVASVTGNMGNMYFSTGDYPSALEHYRRARSLHEELGNRPGAASVTSNMGNTYFNAGDFPTALQHYRSALEMYQELGNSVGIASATGNIGGVYYNTNDYATALEHYRSALAMHEEQDNRAGMAIITVNIGLVHKNYGDHLSTLEHLRQALALYEELGNSAGVVFALGILIATLVKLERHDEAAELLERQASMRMDSPNVVALHHYNRALLAEHLGDLDAAHRELLKALSISTEAGLRSDAVEYHSSLRDLAQRRNDFAGYIEHNNEYQRLTEEIRGKEATQRMAMMDAERKAEAVERERQKERALLYGALPRSVADRMIRGEDVSGDHFDHAAVMFLDIVGFTSHTSAMPPSDVVKLLENIFRTIDSVCNAYGVIKVKTIGDSYMCFRGDADAATNAGSIASVALDVMKHVFSWPDGTQVQFRIGMHIGPATAGVIGTERLQYDVWGDTVNVASRMESSGIAGRGHISAAFAAEIESRIKNQETDHESGIKNAIENREYRMEERGEIDVKGKGMMMTYWLEHSA